MKRATSLLLAVAALLLAPQAIAQTTGQLSGRVVDGQTGETLPGANVRIEGTTQGASTNIDGEYRVIGVRPGTYTLVATFVGYTPARTENVRVNVDLTTTIDFSLQGEEFGGQEVVVVAQADLVRRDLTSSEFRVTSENIDALPVQEVSDILRTQAGITGDGGSIHIRGGRAKEVAYFVDGVRVTDGYDGSVAVQIENEGIEELQIIAGTYNAEYGQANSGIINVVTKDPGRTFEGSFEAFTGSYAVAGDGGTDALRGTNVGDYPVIGQVPYIGVDPYSYLDVNPLQYSNLQASLSGPIIRDRFGFFGLVRYFQNDGWLYGARNFNIDGTPGDSALVGMNGFEKLSGQGTLKLRMNGSMNLTFTTLLSRTMGDGGSSYLAFRQNPDGIRSYQDDGLSSNLQFTHTFSNRAFYTLNASTFFKKNTTQAFDTIEEYGNNTFLLDTPEYVSVGADSIRVVTGSGRFLRGGVDIGRFTRTTRNYSFKGDLNWQALDEHLTKTGLELRLDDISLESYGLTLDPNDSSRLVVPDASTNAYQLISGVNPLTFSAYIQDKAEYDSFVINAGLRFDYFNSNGEIPIDSEDPNVFNPQKLINRYRDANGNGSIEPEEVDETNLTTLEERLAYWYRPADAKYQISPRLGVAYPITSSGVIHFSYGYFFQIPTYEFLFQNPGYRVGVLSGNYGPYGNADLDPQRTVMYEIGLKQSFGDDYVLDMTGFYRDITDWVSVSFPIDAALPGVSYLEYTNLDFSNVRGITVSMSKRFNGLFSFNADYTYQIAEGSNSDPNDAIAARNGSDSPRLSLIPLGWDQRHTFNASVFVGGTGWGTSLIGRTGTGYPYTPVLANATTIGTLPAVPNNSARRPATSTVDLYSYYDLYFAGAKARAFLQVYNLLDARNPGSVYGDTGLPDVTFLGPSLATNDPGYYVRPEFYAEPRRIQLGVELGF